MVQIETNRRTVTRRDIRRWRRKFGKGEPALSNAISYAGNQSDSEARREVYTSVLFGVAESCPLIKDGPIPKREDLVHKAVNALGEFEAKQPESNGQNRSYIGQQTIESFVRDVQAIIHRDNGAFWHNGESNELQPIIKNRRRIWGVASVAGIAMANAIAYGALDLYHGLISGSNADLYWHVTSGVNPDLTRVYLDILPSFHGAATLISGVASFLGWKYFASKKAAERSYADTKKAELIDFHTRNLPRQN